MGIIEKSKQTAIKKNWQIFAKRIRI